MRSDAEKIRALKERTGHSLLSCKLALREADGNYIRALEILKARTYESMRRAGGVLDSAGGGG
jgi:translation elongation factor EF-Ts